MTVKEAALVLGVSTREIHWRLSRDDIASRLNNQQFEVDIQLPGEWSDGREPHSPAPAPKRITAPQIRQPAPVPERTPQVEPKTSATPLLRSIPFVPGAHGSVASRQRRDRRRAHLGWVLIVMLVLSLFGVGVSQWTQNALDRWQNESTLDG